MPGASVELLAQRLCMHPVAFRLKMAPTCPASRLFRCSSRVLFDATFTIPAGDSFHVNACINLFSLVVSAGAHADVVHLNVSARIEAPVLSFTNTRTSFAAQMRTCQANAVLL